MKPIESQKEALSFGRNSLEKAACKGPWLVAVFWLEEGKLEMDRATWEFPKEKMKDVVEALSKDLASEKMDLLPDDPLPDAEEETMPQLTPATLPMPNVSQGDAGIPAGMIETPDEIRRQQKLVGVAETPDDLNIDEVTQPPKQED